MTRASPSLPRVDRTLLFFLIRRCNGSNAPKGWLIGLTMLVAMTLNMLVGTLVGMLVPLALHRHGRDPALGSSVLLTFTTDSMGVFIFLGLATLFFR